MVVPTVLYGSDSWVPNIRERRIEGVFDEECLREGEMRRIRNKDLRGRCGKKTSLLERMDQSTLLIWRVQMKGSYEEDL